ncbi:oligosaccharide flippase family protein [Lutimonas halocynthiae]|uniref:oligosaccharide flippase family protein n=1 Tax=Lutimonas halocynthiae TaxID=1446477 RepID=UPI0025B4A494|nr:oligosaccharide flippase family protein [Lutimonas halocynthiae]MDN3642107.1 oligosaccharide flippase family protein [Lutimonas halocynthiae]
MNIFNLSNLNADGKIIFKNFSYLSMLRVFNILSQYILVSFLVRTLGGETYGVFVWAFSIIQYLVIVVNFGFNTYAAKYVTEDHNDPNRINTVFSSIMGIKISLFILSSILLLISLSFFPLLRENSFLLLILLGFAFGEAVFPIWFFQGSEKLEIPTKIVFVFRLLLVITTLWFITQTEHLLRYALLLTISQILIGFFGLIFAITKLNIKIVRFGFSDVTNLIKESFAFFIGGLFGKSFNFAAIMLIGIYCSMKDVSSFDISFKIIAVMQLPFETLSVVLFPTIARTKNLLLNQKIIFIGFSVSLLFWAFTYWQAAFLMNLLGGAELMEYSSLLQRLSILIPVVVLTYLLGPNTLIAFGHQNHFNYSFIIPSTIYILILLFLWNTDSLNFEIIIMSRILVDVMMAIYRLVVAIHYRLIFISR